MYMDYPVTYADVLYNMDDVNFGHNAWWQGKTILIESLNSAYDPTCCSPNNCGSLGRNGGN